MANAWKIEGLPELYKWMDKQAPEDVVKLSKASMKKAMSEASRTVRRKTPPRWKRLTKGKVAMVNGKIIGTFGYFNGHQQTGRQNPEDPIDDWFKMYWNNYGTLSRRDPNHVFKNPVRHGGTSAAKRRRNRVGIPHLNFFERAIEGTLEKAIDTYVKEIEKADL